LSISPTHSIQLGLYGQDGTNYVVETSTNLTSWQQFSSVQTRNGAAAVTYNLGTNKSLLFFRARAGGTNTSTGLQLQTSRSYTADGLVTPDGGGAELLAPGLQHITLTVPPGCVTEPQTFTMTLVTNVVGLPFAQGTFGTVVLAPADLVFSGAASLEIDFPSGADPRQLVSFSANADGTDFSLTLDRFLTNRVLIPITRLGIYGSALATAAELNAFLNVPRIASRLSDSTGCAPKASDADGAPYLQSSEECFGQLVQRALAVRADLNQFIRCNFIEPATQQLTQARQQQLTSTNDIAPAVIDHAWTNLCSIYQTKIDPLWAEATQNCPLAQELLRFMLSIEREVQLLGINVNDCAIGLTNYDVFICSGAKECLREIAECCRQGRKGGGKVTEAIGVIRQFELLGNSGVCFGEDYMANEEFQAVVQACETNSWVGTLKIKLAGEYNSFTNYYTDTAKFDLVNETQIQSVDVEFDGQVYQSMDDLFLDSGEEYLDLSISGSGSGKFKLDHLLDEEIVCQSISNRPDPQWPHRYRHATETTTIGKTNFFGQYINNSISTNIAGNYEFTFILKTNKTYQIQILGNDNVIITTADARTFSESMHANCGGDVTFKTDGPYGPFTATIVCPTLYAPANNPYTFAMPNTNVIKGSVDVTNDPSAESTFSPVKVTTHFEWYFQRNTNVPALTF
jgi:hypothetical protein